MFLFWKKKGNFVAAIRITLWKSWKNPGTLMQKVVEKVKKSPGKSWNLNHFLVGTMTQLFRIILYRKMKGKQKTIHRHWTTSLALALKKACTYRLCDLREAFFEHINVLNHIQEAWNIQESYYFPLLWKPFYRSKEDSTKISKHDFSIKPLFFVS